MRLIHECLRYVLAGRVKFTMRMFQKNSPLFTMCCARTFLALDMTVVISGVRVPPPILGDSAYALRDWLMKPYTDRGNLTPEEANFNIKHSMSRVVVENAFGRLKGRFRSIGKRLDLNVENSCNVIAACCVLHCEYLHEFFDDLWSKADHQCHCNKRCN